MLKLTQGQKLETEVLETFIGQLPDASAAQAPIPEEGFAELSCCHAPGAEADAGAEAGDPGAGVADRLASVFMVLSIIVRYQFIGRRCVVCARC